MQRPNHETPVAPMLTMNNLSPEEARFRDWLIDGSARLSANSDRDKPAPPPKPRRPPEDPSEPRVAAGRNSIIFNLGNAGGDTIELMPGGWKIAGSPARAASRTRTVAGLPYPDEPSSLPVNFLTFRSLLNLNGQDDWDRCLCWLLAALRPEGPYPILVVTGPKASGKTTAALLLRSLIDPAQFPLIPLTSNERHIGLLAQFHWVLAFDEVKSVASHLSSGIQAANRPVILVVPADANWTPGPELANRVLIVTTRPLPAEKVQKPGAIWWDFKTVRPKTLSALLTAVCVALGNHKSPGFSDLAAWLNAAEPAVKLSSAEIRAILTPRKSKLAPDSNLAETITALMTIASPWTGTATKLLQAVHAIDPASTDWPKTPQTISDRLNQSVAKLRLQKIEMKFEGKGQISITRV